MFSNTSSRRHAVVCGGVFILVAAVIGSGCGGSDDAGANGNGDGNGNGNGNGNGGGNGGADAGLEGATLSPTAIGDHVHLHSLTRTADGDFIAVGEFEGTATIDDVELQSAGNTDGVAVRLSASGEIDWVRHLGEGHLDVALEVVDATDDGGAVIAGRARDLAEFDGETIDTGVHPGGVVLKIDGSGEAEWVQPVGVDSDDFVSLSAVVATEEDGAVAAGYTSHRESTVTAGDTVLDIQTAGAGVAFRFDGQGEVEWGNVVIGSDFADGVHDAAATRIGDDALIAWQAAREIVLDGDPFTSLDDFEIVVTRLGSGGEVEWGSLVGDGESMSFVETLTATADGNAIGMARHNTDVEIDGENFEARAQSDGLTYKIDAQGDVKWARQTGTIREDDDFLSALFEPTAAVPTAGGGTLHFTSVRYGYHQDPVAKFGEHEIELAPTEDPHPGLTMTAVMFEVGAEGEVVWAEPIGSTDGFLQLADVQEAQDGSLVTLANFSGPLVLGDRQAENRETHSSVVFTLDTEGALIEVF